MHVLTKFTQGHLLLESIPYIYKGMYSTSVHFKEQNKGDICLSTTLLKNIITTIETYILLSPTTCLDFELITLFFCFATYVYIPKQYTVLF